MIELDIPNTLLQELPEDNRCWFVVDLVNCIINPKQSGFTLEDALRVVPPGETDLIKLIKLAFENKIGLTYIHLSFGKEATKEFAIKTLIDMFNGHYKGEPLNFGDSRRKV